MENHAAYIEAESALRLRATVIELDQLIQAEKEEDRLKELKKLRDEIESLLQHLHLVVH